VARNYYPVAQKLTIRIGRNGRSGAESYCASGSHVECFYQPQRKQQWSRYLHNDKNGEVQRSAPIASSWRDDDYVEFELVVDDNHSASDFNHLHDDNG